MEFYVNVWWNQNFLEYCYCFPSFHPLIILFSTKSIISSTSLNFRCSVKLGWELLAIFLTFFAPTDKVLQYIENFLTEYSKEDDDSCISSDNQTSTAAAVESQGSSLAAQESQSVELEEGAFPTALEKV